MLKNSKLFTSFLIVIAASLLFYLFDILYQAESKESQTTETAKNSFNNKVGFYCEPKGAYGFLILVIYDGEYVSSYHDKIYLRPDGWVVTKLNSAPFDFHYGNIDYPVIDWYVPKAKYSQYQTKRHMHNVGHKQVDEKYKSSLITVEEYAGEEDIKYMHNCFLGNIEQMNEYVENRKTNLLD
jgi:hypothetical protein